MKSNIKRIPSVTTTATKPKATIKATPTTRILNRKTSASSVSDLAIAIALSRALAAAPAKAKKAN